MGSLPFSLKSSFKVFSFFFFFLTKSLYNIFIHNISKLRTIQIFINKGTDELFVNHTTEQFILFTAERGCFWEWPEVAAIDHIWHIEVFVCLILFKILTCCQHIQSRDFTLFCIYRLSWDSGGSSPFLATTGWSSVAGVLSRWAPCSPVCHSP